MQRGIDPRLPAFAMGAAPLTVRSLSHGERVGVRGYGLR
jgi:hypothetical protein